MRQEVVQGLVVQSVMRDIARWGIEDQVFQRLLETRPQWESLPVCCSTWGEYQAKHESKGGG